MKWVLASANRGKLAELQALLAPSGIELVSQGALGIASIEETGSSFEDNALLKARHAASASGLPALADDSGLDVDALGGEPGIHSARYAGAQASDEANNTKLLKALSAIPAPQRTARYRCVLALVRSADDPAPALFRGVWEGQIARSPDGERGFGYDPLFIPRGCASTVARMSPAAKDAASHRGQALRALLAALPAMVR